MSFVNFCRQFALQEATDLQDTSSPRLAATKSGGACYNMLNTAVNDKLCGFGYWYVCMYLTDVWNAFLGFWLPVSPLVVEDDAKITGRQWTARSPDVASAGWTTASGCRMCGFAATLQLGPFICFNCLFPLYKITIIGEKHQNTGKNEVHIWYLSLFIWEYTFYEWGYNYL